MRRAYREVCAHANMLPNNRIGKEPRRGPPTPLLGGVRSEAWLYTWLMAAELPSASSSTCSTQDLDMEMEAWRVSCREMLNAHAKCLICQK